MILLLYILNTTKYSTISFGCENAAIWVGMSILQIQYGDKNVCINLILMSDQNDTFTLYKMCMIYFLLRE